MFIKLHYISDNTEVTINTDYITSYCSVENGTEIAMVDDPPDSCRRVAESYEEVDKMITGVDKEESEDAADGNSD